ncbi:hypothetical protein PSCI_0339 [Pseudomonas sp. StFLB209]|nr:hypothetical protein PSCI_0339 [Pseudomonas sp. StFLB209]
MNSGGAVHNHIDTCDKLMPAVIGRQVIDHDHFNRRVQPVPNLTHSRPHAGHLKGNQTPYQSPANKSCRARYRNRYRLAHSLTLNI